MAIKGTATGMARNVDRVQLASGLYLADITDAVGVTSWDFRVGAVSEFTFPAVDRNRELSKRGLLREGVTLKWDGENWQIAVVERDYKGDDIWLNFTARSRLARRLRNMTGSGKSTEKDTPQAFIGRAVKKAGGSALVEPGAGRMRIVQKRGESVLDVIGNIASDTGVEWVEHGNTFFVGTPWWAFKEDLGLPTWTARADGTLPDIGDKVLSALTLSTRSSLDDRKNAAEAQMTVEIGTGAKVRPWHKVNLTRADDADQGLWLVSDVTFDEVSGSADLSLTRPLKSSPKKGSTPSSTASSTDTGGLEPLKDSSYSDAPRPSSWSGRSVAGIVALFKNNPGGLGGHPIYNGCLWYAQEAAGYPHIGDNPHVLWTMLATSKRHSNRKVVPGAVLLYRTSRIGHATVYLGGGQVLGTDMDSNGNYSPGNWSIAPADACERSFGTLLGWYSP